MNGKISSSFGSFSITHETVLDEGKYDGILYFIDVKNVRKFYSQKSNSKVIPYIQISIRMSSDKGDVKKILEAESNSQQQVFNTNDIQ